MLHATFVQYTSASAKLKLKGTDHFRFKFETNGAFGIHSPFGGSYREHLSSSQSLAVVNPACSGRTHARGTADRLRSAGRWRTEAVWV